MTEVEWLECTDPQKMPGFLKGTASRRKLRLFAVDCCRRHRQMLVSETTSCLEVAEQFAEGRIGHPERREARERAFAAPWHQNPEFRHRRGPAKACVTSALARQAFEAARLASRYALGIGVPGKDWFAGREEEQVLQANVLRDIFGNPFRPVTVEPSWLTPAVTSLGQSIYDCRSFERMPELADALEAARCSNQPIVDHCRRAGLHVLGCWALDFVLGKG